MRWQMIQALEASTLSCLISGLLPAPVSEGSRQRMLT